MTPQRLWPGDAPGAVGAEPLDVPTLTIHPADPDRTTRSAIVVCPGGGYQHLADHEGEPVARWLNRLGITAAVLRYRIAPRYRHPAPLLDAARALRTMRARSADLAIDPRRVGILGFSAGGHLASTLSTRFDAGNADSPDPVERCSSRPDVSVLLYPVITMGPHAHAGSRRNLLGAIPSPEQVDQLSNEKQVTPDTPPTFLFHTVADAAVPVENALHYAAALRTAGVPFDLHLYERGRHGVGLAAADPVLSTWTTLCANWLALHGFVKQPS